MASHPEIQARAHAELDKVVGGDNWPSAEDEQRLPYIRAVIKEVCYEAWTLRLSFFKSSVPSGGAVPLTILDTGTALFDGRLCIQRDVHPEEHNADLKLLRHSPQRGEISGLVSNYFPFVDLFKAENDISRNRFVFNPDRYLDDPLTSAESSKLPNAMDRDHWAFGAGYVPMCFSPCWAS
jgi:hypothetical protein